MTNFSSDYSNTRSDLYSYLFDGVSTVTDAGVFVGSSTIVTRSSSPHKISGALKAAQNFARILLTPLGSKREDPTCGSKFVDDISSSTLYYPIQIEHIFSRNTLYVTSYLKKQYDDSTPRDEFIRRVVLISFDRPAPTQLSFVARVDFDSGRNLSIKIPIRS